MLERSSSGILRVCFEALTLFKWWRRRKDRVKEELVKKQNKKKAAGKRTFGEAVGKRPRTEQEERWRI